MAEALPTLAGGTSMADLAPWSMGEAYCADRRHYFLGAPFDGIRKEAVLSLLDNCSSHARFRYVVTPNVDHVVRLNGNAGLAPLLRPGLAFALRQPADLKIGQASVIGSASRDWLGPYSRSLQLCDPGRGKDHVDRGQRGDCAGNGAGIPPGLFPRQGAPPRLFTPTPQRQWIVLILPHGRKHASSS